MKIEFAHARAAAAAMTLIGVIAAPPSAAFASNVVGYTAGQSCVGVNEDSRYDLDFNSNGIVNTDTANSAYLMCPITPMCQGSCRVGKVA